MLLGGPHRMEMTAQMLPHQEDSTNDHCKQGKVASKDRITTPCPCVEQHAMTNGTKLDGNFPFTSQLDSLVCGHVVRTTWGDPAS
eukprot:2429155-Amphidinium_carterae.1